MQSAAVWETLVFVLNSLLFVLVGLQLPRVVDGLSGVSAATLLGYATLMSATVIVVRLVFVFVIAYAVRYVLRWTHGREPLGWRNVAVVGWAGMRGAVALAAALAIPLETDAGGAFPERDLVVFLTFSVIVATLVFQGLTLPAIIRALGVEDDGLDRHEESKARYKAAVAAIARIDELTEEEWVREDTAERMKRLYEYRRRRFGSRFDENDDGAIEEQSLGYQRLRREALEAERSAIVELRNRGVINDEVMRRVERDLDLEDVRLEI
jgi:CPA1 family monovalent cation:H+ antiporter